LLCSCAPNRDPGQDDEDTTTLPGLQLQSALFSSPQDAGDFQFANLSLLDDELSCDQLAWGGGLELWNLGPEVHYVSIELFLGGDLDDWQRDYAPFEFWEESCESGDECDVMTAALFGGEVGISDDIRDGEVPVDEPIGGSGTSSGSEGSTGREITGELGTDPDDSLTITGYTDTLVTGYVQSAAGDYAFMAERCSTADPGVPPSNDVDGVDSPE